MKDKIYIILDQLVQSGTNFIIILLFVKLLSVEEFKIYVITTSIVLMIQPFLSTIVNSIIIKQKEQEFISKLEAIFFMVVIIALFILLIFNNSNAVIVSYVLIMSFTEYLRLLFVMRKMYSKLFYYDIAISIVKYILIYCLYIFTLNIYEYLLGTLIAFLLIFMYFKNIEIQRIYIEIKLFFNSWQVISKVYRSLLSQSVPLIILGQLTIPIAAYFISAVEIQVYSVVVSYTSSIFLIYQAFNKYFLVEFSSLKTNLKKNQYLHQVYKILLFIFPLILLIVYNNKYLLTILYSEKISYYAFVFNIVLIINFFVLFSQIMTVMLSTTPLINYLTKITYIQIIFFLLFFIPLVYFYQLYGLITYYILIRLLQVLMTIYIYTIFLTKYNIRIQDKS